MGFIGLVFLGVAAGIWYRCIHRRRPDSCDHNSNQGEYNEQMDDETADPSQDIEMNSSNKNNNSRIESREEE